MNDRYKRRLFLKNELRSKILKSIIKNKSISYTKRYLSSFYITKLPLISTKANISNRCVISGRIWSTNYKTKLSRFVFREKMYKSFLPGCRRASW